MKLNYWRLGVKAVLAAVLVGVMTVFTQLAHPVLSAQSTVGQLADTVESSAQMTAYGWLMPVGWSVVAVSVFVLVLIEIRAIRRDNEKKEADRS